MKNIIEVINVTKKYDGFILDNINFTFQEGSIMGLIGPNGAGKTTLINSILDIIKLDSGSIRVFGKDHTQLTKEDKEDLAVVYDENSLPEHLNSKEVGKIFKELYTNWNHKDYIQYLERLRIPQKVAIKDMSKGNKVKINLAVALAHNPRLLILDEIDAFPFKNNLVLHSFLNRSLKGNLLLMTATISDYEKETFRNNKFEIIELYQRFHGYKMPVPKIVLKTGIFKLLYLLKKVKEFVDNKKPLLIFVGYIKDSINLFTFINIFVKGGAYLNSKVEKRENIINEFKRGELKYIVTTSVLERGVTLSNLQVIVYDSYKNVFDSQTLIQISGRVGRKKEFPNGEIIFLSYKKTKEMENAIKTIIEENNIRE